MSNSTVACKKCHYVLIDPVKCGKCKQHNCENCVRSCCHGFDSPAEEPDREVLQELAQLRFRCCYQGRGCRYHLAHNELVAHERHCERAETCGECNSADLDPLAPFAQDDPHLETCDQIKSAKSQSWYEKGWGTLKEASLLRDSGLSETHSCVCDSESTEAEEGFPTLREAREAYEQEQEEEEHTPADQGHSSCVHTLLTLKDGLIASCSEGLIQVCDAATGKRKRTFKSERTFQALADLGNGKLASASDDLSVCIWPIDSDKDPKREKVLRVRTNKVTFNEPVETCRSLVLLPSGSLASGGSDQPVRIWNPKTGESEKVLKGAKNKVTALAVFDNGNLALGSADESVRIRIWNAISGKYSMLKGQGHQGPVRVLVVLANGNLISGSEDCTSKVWHPDSGLLRTLVGHKARVSALVELPNGDIVSGSHDKSVRVYKKDSETCIRVFAVDSLVSSINYDKLNQSIILGLGNGQIQKLK